MNLAGEGRQGQGKFVDFSGNSGKHWVEFFAGGKERERGRE